MRSWKNEIEENNLKDEEKVDEFANSNCTFIYSSNIYYFKNQSIKLI